MQTFKTSYRGLSLLVDLNWDRALYFGFLIIALTAGAWIARNAVLSPYPGALPHSIVIQLAAIHSI